MSALADWKWALDGWIVAAGILCGVASALLGNFLVLRRMSMLGDAISHAVLPGLVAAFFISDSRHSTPMFVGAVIVGVLTAFFTEWIRGAGKVDEGASMGVVFTSLFALGLVFVVQAADYVDLDPGCVLYGAIEETPINVSYVAGFKIPTAVITLGIVAIVNAVFVACFYKELRISSFDPALATTMGFSARLMHYLLMVLVAVTAVASFESVGNILVVAMLVVPPAAAYMLTDRLDVMIFLSVAIAVASAVVGHISAIVVPSWFGFPSTTTAGMMASVSGGILFLAIVFAPRHGVLIKFVRRRWLAWSILADDVIALLYKLQERGGTTPANRENLQDALLTDQLSLRLILSWLTRRGFLEHTAHVYRLEPKGTSRARELVRSHRLWEQYLVSQAGVDAHRIHDTAERLEHFTDQELRHRLDDETDRPTVDPHGSPIPAESPPPP